MKIELSAAQKFLDELCAGLEEPHLLAAVSGGEDSMCLLHLLCNWCKKHDARLTVGHLNHGLRGESAMRDETFVREHCAAWGVPFVVEQGDVGGYAERTGKSTEEAGRELRYDFLQRTAAEHGCHWILTAHHANDNAETVLLNLLRGTGSRGLAGIPAVRDNIARPLLTTTRAEIAAYAMQHGIGHVTDECNLDPNEASRNLLRQKVLPLLEELNPRAVENINRAAATLRRESAALDALAEERIAALQPLENGWRIACEALLPVEDAVSERTALLLLERVCGARRDLSAVHVAALVQLAGGKNRGQLDLPYGVTVRHCGDALEFFHTVQPPEEQVLEAGKSVCFGSYELRLCADVTAEETAAIRLREEACQGILSVGPWRSGEGMCLAPARGRRSLKRIFSERGIAPTERENLPVIRCGGKVAAVWPVGTDLDFTPDEGGKHITITIKNINQTSEG